jgi:hypothetical protein
MWISGLGPEVHVSQLNSSGSLERLVCQWEEGASAISERPPTPPPPPPPPPKDEQPFDSSTFDEGDRRLEVKLWSPRYCFYNTRVLGNTVFIEAVCIFWGALILLRCISVLCSTETSMHKRLDPSAPSMGGRTSGSARRIMSSCPPAH